MSTDPQRAIDPEVIDCPTAWFAALESARRRDDYERAAEAVRQLSRLGVTVRFGRRTVATAQGARDD